MFLFTRLIKYQLKMWWFSIIEGHPKKGTCYLLNNGIIGVLFLDQSVILFCPIKKTFYYERDEYTYEG